MKITYDPYADALNLTFREGKIRETIELAPEIILDIDIKKRPLYLEIIGAKEKLGKQSASEITMSNFSFPVSRALVA